MEIKNAIITGTMLGYEDHGIFTAGIYLDYGGSSQMFGGYVLDVYLKSIDERKGTAYGHQWIIDVLKTLEVEKWESLPKTHVRVKADFNKVRAIGHYFKDKWFDPMVLATASKIMEFQCPKP